MTFTRIAAALAALSLSAGCGDLAFRVDDRLTITAPSDRALVELPVTVSWVVRDFKIVTPGSTSAAKDQGYFAVFVDRAPVPPGKPLEWLARADDDCKRDQGCPDANYLASLGVFTTTDTSFVVERTLRHSGSSKDRHQVVVILMDAEGRRIGESAYRVVFDVKRKQL